MILSIRPLGAFTNINSYSYDAAFQLTQGDTPTLYFQLVDLSRNLAYYGFNPIGAAYHPSSTAILALTIQSIDDAKRITRFATLVSANDTSIWSFALTNTDIIKGNANIQLTLTDGSLVLHGYAGSVIRTTSFNPGC